MKTKRHIPLRQCFILCFCLSGQCQAPRSCRLAFFYIYSRHEASTGIGSKWPNRPETLVASDAFSVINGRFCRTIIRVNVATLYSKHVTLVRASSNYWFVVLNSHYYSFMDDCLKSILVSKFPAYFVQGERVVRPSSHPR